MTKNLKKPLKKRYKLKSYYKNGRQKSDYDKVLEISADCTKKITQPKNDFINKITLKYFYCSYDVLGYSESFTL